jgi:hypothetical protein
MKATYEILVDEPEPAGICEQIAFTVNDSGGEIIELHNTQELFTILVAEWPTQKVIDGNLIYGFVHPMFLVEKIRGVLAWKMKNSYKKA